MAWPVLEPGSQFTPGWHIDAVCEHLEAVTHGQIKNLLINMPPRHMKSLAVSVFWPVWEWLTNPSVRWLYASYAQSLSIDHSVSCRRLIESDWFQDRWSDRFQLTSDQNAKVRFDNDRSGYRIATSVTAAATGQGGQRVVVDDAVNARDSASDLKRKGANDWYDKTMSTRINDQRVDSKVIVAQRLHQDDLPGHILEKGGFVHLNLPAEFEPKRKCVTSIGWEDPRTEEGELLWPERVGPEQIAELKNLLGPTAYAGQFQQRPTPEGGAQFKASSLSRAIDIAELPPMIKVVRAWDMAATESNGDYTVGVKMGKDAAGNFYILDVRRERLSSAGVEDIVVKTAELDGKSVTIRIPQDPGAAGKAWAATFVKKLVGYAVKVFQVTGDKIVRAAPFATVCERMIVTLVRANWNGPYIDEMIFFPNGSNDDQVDASSDAFDELTKPTFRLAPAYGGVVSVPR